MDYRPVEENLRAMFRILASRRKTGEVREMPGVTIASLGTAFQMFNAAFLSSPVVDERDLTRRAELAAVHMRVRGLPWALWVCEDWLPQSLRRRSMKVLNRVGLSLASEMPGMAATGVRPPERGLPPLHVKMAESEETMRAFCQIGSACFHVPLAWFEEIFDRETPFRENCASWVAYCEGVPVASAATVTAAGVVGVYNVATLPSFRERGIGEAVMRHALAEAQRISGLETSILQATRQGLGLYERMGYRSVTKILVFTSLAYAS